MIVLLEYYHIVGKIQTKKFAQVPQCRFWQFYFIF